uniref:Small integral membrane protein 14 n=1 Tax=Rhipicephalus appendiculatus TaxID=34631 RepID=A0A131YRN4_RHIAP
MDDGFDPCECIFSHDAAMQRLISLLRSSQSACTDSECLQEMPSMQQAAGGSGFFLVIVGWMLLAMALYYLRPNSLRNRGDGKPDRQGPSNEPPSGSVF